MSVGRAGAHRRCGPRHRALSRPGHELRLRGLRRILDALLAGCRNAFSRFEQARRADTEAIAQMALENYGEMRDAVLDPPSQHKVVAMALERHHPARFIPRYAMVMFHDRIPYSVALRRGAIQARILEELDAGEGREPDLARAEALIRARL